MIKRYTITQSYFDLSVDVSIEADSFLRIASLNVFLKLGVAYFISGFKFPIVITFLLNSVISEVDYLIFEVLEFELTR